MRFFEAAANWADRKYADIKFTRDEYDGWFAIVSFTDARGPFSATVNMVEPHNRRKLKIGGIITVVPKEDTPAFEARVGKMLDKACAVARANRIRKVTKTTNHYLCPQPSFTHFKSARASQWPKPTSSRLSLS